MERLRAALTSLGLAEAEREIYVAVCSRGEATAAAIASEVDVDESTVLSVAGALVERGLLQVRGDGGDAVLAAVPPERAAATFSETVAAFEAAAASAYGGDASAADDAASTFATLGRPRAVRRELRAELAAAEREVIAILPGDLVAEFRADFAAAVERGATVYVLATAPGVERAASTVDAGEHVHVLRTWGARPVCFLLRDVHGAILGEHGAATLPAEATRRSDRSRTPAADRATTPAEPDSSTTPADADAPAIAVRQPHVAGWLNGNAVANIWSCGRQRSLADPPPLPATYEHFRSAVTAAALHDLAGTELTVDVEGRSLTSGEPASLTATPVREVRQSLVEPTNVTFPVENALVVETDDGLVSVGAETSGLAAFHEDYAATSATLRTPR